MFFKNSLVPQLKLESQDLKEALGDSKLELENSMSQMRTIEEHILRGKQNQEQKSNDWGQEEKELKHRHNMLRNVIQIERESRKNMVTKFEALEMERKKLREEIRMAEERKDEAIKKSKKKI